MKTSEAGSSESASFALWLHYPAQTGLKRTRTACRCVRSSRSHSTYHGVQLCWVIDEKPRLARDESVHRKLESMPECSSGAVPDSFYFSPGSGKIQTLENGMSFRQFGWIIELSNAFLICLNEMASTSRFSSCFRGGMSCSIELTKACNNLKNR